MARLIDSTPQTESAHWRRHADPPSLWWMAIGGSAVLHVLLALTLRWWSIQVAIAQPSAASSVPIELIEIAPEADSPDVQASSPTATAAQDPTTAAPTQAGAEVFAPEPGVATVISESLNTSIPSPTAPSPSPEPQVFQPLQPSPATPQASLPFTPPVLPRPDLSPNPNANLSPAPNPETIPETIPDTRDVPPANTDNQAPAPPDNSSPLPEPNNSPASEPPSTDSAPSEPQNQTETAPDPGEEATETPAPLSPSAPDSAPPPGNDSIGEPIGQVPVSQDPVPAQFQASLTVSAPANGRDIHDQLAQPKVATQTFLSDASASACLLDPSSVRSFGQSVLLSIAIDEQGQVIGGGVRESSGNGAYDELAMCLMNSWEFNPAADFKDGSPSPVASNLDVRVVIDRL